MDILHAVEAHALKPAGIFTDEDAKNYKPRSELLELQEQLVYDIK